MHGSRLVFDRPAVHAGNIRAYTTWPAPVGRRGALRGIRTMLQCHDCEHFVAGPGGQVGFKCNPFGNIKEPECLIKWQLLRMNEMSQKMDRMAAAYEATVKIYKRLQPLQEKMFRYMEQEIDEQQEGDSWKYGGDDEENDEEISDPGLGP